MQDKQLLFYMHAGSGNHGCEAIAVSTLELLKKQNNEDIKKVLLVTNSSFEDEKYDIGEISKSGRCSIVEERHIAKHKITHVLYYIYRKITGDAESFYRYRYADALAKLDKNAETIAVSIGGDNYCYPEMVKDLVLSHNVFKNMKMKTVLMGCSVEPDSVPSLKEDLESYDMIIARESITYEGLIAGGISKDKVMLCPDPAFALPTKIVELPQLFKKSEVVGINVSPMVQGKESAPGMTMENYRALIRYILDNTSLGVALIPHVVWKSNDDRGPLNALYNEFKNYKGQSRVEIIHDMPATNLKGIISRCKFFVGARTHSTIAAYSSLVPTLVIGYSVKSRGIAKDLFGQDENYVIPVWALKKEDDLLNGFKWIMDNELAIRATLKEKMPEYIEEAGKNISF